MALSMSLQKDFARLSFEREMDVRNKHSGRALARRDASRTRSSQAKILTLTVVLSVLLPVLLSKLLTH